MLLSTLCAVTPGSATAQWRDTRFDRIAARAQTLPPLTQDQNAPTGALVTGGVLAALVGFVGGAYFGYHVERSNFPCSCDDPGLGGLIVGAIGGPTIAIPTFVHLLNERRGDYGTSLFVSAMIGGVGILALMAGAGTTESGLVFLFGPPIAQIVTSVNIESRK